jgi:hypothetical protein
MPHKAFGFWSFLFYPIEKRKKQKERDAMGRLPRIGQTTHLTSRQQPPLPHHTCTATMKSWDLALSSL